LDSEIVELITVVAAEGRPDTKIIVGLIIMVIKNTIIKYKWGLADMNVSS
jgi:uncharacterized membrane protein